MEMNVSSWCSELRRKFVGWILYHVCFCSSVAFMSSLVTSYHFVKYVVTSVLTTYILELGERSHILLIAATLNKIFGGLAATFEVILIFISDSHIGGFKTVLFSSASFIAGLTMMLFWEKTTYSGRLVLNTIAIFCLAIGYGGKETLTKFLTEQLRAKEPTGQPIEEDRVMARTRLWYRATWFIAVVVAVLLFRNSSWSKIFSYSASAMAFSYLVFIFGIRFYHCKEATTRKHDFDASSFRQAMQKCKSKSVIRFLLPTWGFSIILGIGFSTADAFFQVQAIDLKFPFDITTLLVLEAISGRGFSFIYDFILSKCQSAKTLKIMKSWIKVWIGMLLIVACLLVGWRVEAYRHTLEYEGKIPQLLLWLSIQFLLLGPAKTFVEDGLNNFLEEHLGESSNKYAPSLNGFAIGCLGNFSSIILLQIQRRWFLYYLDSSRLDKYYLLVAILNFINLCSSILWKFCSHGGFCNSGTSVHPNPETDVEPPMVVEEATPELLSYLVD